MNNNQSTAIDNKKPSRKYHYLGMLAFGSLYSIFLRVVIEGEVFTAHERMAESVYWISNGLGGGSVFLLLGFLITSWKGINAGWFAVFIWAFFSYMGS